MAGLETHTLPGPSTSVYGETRQVTEVLADGNVSCCSRCRRSRCHQVGRGRFPMFSPSEVRDLVHQPARPTSKLAVQKAMAAAMLISRESGTDMCGPLLCGIFTPPQKRQIIQESTSSFFSTSQPLNPNRQNGNPSTVQPLVRKPAVSGCSTTKPLLVNILGFSSGRLGRLVGTGRVRVDWSTWSTGCRCQKHSRSAPNPGNWLGGEHNERRVDRNV